MLPLASQDTPAYRAAKLFQHGANLGNYLEVPPGKNWAVAFSPDELTSMKQEGFDHVRVPIGWHNYAGPGPDFALSPEMFARADSVVTNALAAGLAVMINLHRFNEMDQDPAGNTEKFLALWRQIAGHYRSYPDSLAFELDNEPNKNATTPVMNAIYARVIPEIRGSNSRRTLFVEPGAWGGIGELKNLVLPPDDNVIVSVHCYDPFLFTHQGASWTDTPVTGIVFPGPPPQPFVPGTNLNLKPKQLDWIKKYNTLPTDSNPCGPSAFANKLQFLHDWSAYYRRPVHIGEFGAYIKADLQSRANFYSAFRRAAESQQLGWCIWNWSADFNYWDQKNHRSLPGMRSALFRSKE